MSPAAFSADAGLVLDTLRSDFRTVGTGRRWSFHWTERSGYAHGELAELVEAVRGKRGVIVEEAADALLTMMALIPADVPMREVLGAAARKIVMIACGECGVDGEGAQS